MSLIMGTIVGVKGILSINALAIADIQIIAGNVIHGSPHVIPSTILASNEISPISSKIYTTTKRPVKKIRVAQSTYCKTFSTCVLVIIKRMAAPPNAIIDTSIPIVP